MWLRFAPLRLPLRRRLQTAAVLQWAFSFLALGEDGTVPAAAAWQGPRAAAAAAKLVVSRPR